MLVKQAHGLDKHPSYNELIRFLETDKTKIKYPDRSATFVRNGPYWSQFDTALQKIADPKNFRPGPPYADPYQRPPGPPGPPGPPPRGAANPNSGGPMVFPMTGSAPLNVPPGGGQPGSEASDLSADIQNEELMALRPLPPPSLTYIPNTDTNAIQQVNPSLLERARGAVAGLAQNAASAGVGMIADQAGNLAQDWFRNAFANQTVDQQFGNLMAQGARRSAAGGMGLLMPAAEAAVSTPMGAVAAGAGLMIADTMFQNRIQVPLLQLQEQRAQHAIGNMPQAGLDTRTLNGENDRRPMEFNTLMNTGSASSRVPAAIMDRPQTSLAMFTPPSSASQLALGDIPSMNPPRSRTIASEPFVGNYQEGGASSSGARSSNVPYYGLGRGPVQNAPKIPRSRDRRGAIYDTRFVPDVDFQNAPKKYSSTGETFRTTTAQKGVNNRKEMLSSPPNPMSYNKDRDANEKWFD
jgi:hypothetical protein